MPTGIVPSLNDYGPKNPLYIAHRGSAARYPEDTLTAYDAAYDAGLRVMEAGDTHLLSDGGMAIMHDTTVDRVCSPATGALATMTTARFKDLTMPTDTWLAGGFGTIKPTLLTEVISKYAGKIIFAPEVKATGVGLGQRMVNAFLAYGVPRDQLIVACTTLPDLAPAVTAGYQVMLDVFDGAGGDKAAIWAAGVRWVSMSAAAATDANVASWIAFGFKVVMYTIQRRWLRDKYLALGVTGFYSNDAEYLSSDSMAYPIDSFATGRWPPGVFVSADDPAPANRGKMSGGYYLWDNQGAKFSLQGWLGRLKSGASTLYADLTFDAATGNDPTRWLSVFLADASMSDREFNNGGATTENGYHFLIRKNQQLQIFKVTAGVATSLTASATGTTLADGTEMRVRIDITATQLTIAFLNADGSTAASTSIADATYRGGYLHFGHSGLAGRFRNVRLA